MEQQLGWHWIFDAWIENAAACDERLLTRVLEDLPTRLELTLVSAPQVFAQHTRPRSTAGIVLLAESHFSLHVLADRGLVHGDLFSCKAFDVDVARRALGQHFEVARLVDRVLDRGTAHVRAGT